MAFQLRLIEFQGSTIFNSMSIRLFDLKGGSKKDLKKGNLKSLKTFFRPLYQTSVCGP